MRTGSRWLFAGVFVVACVRIIPPDYWGVGPAVQLATGFKGALEQLGVAGKGGGGNP